MDDSSKLDFLSDFESFGFGVPNKFSKSSHYVPFISQSIPKVSLDGDSPHVPKRNILAT